MKVVERIIEIRRVRQQLALEPQHSVSIVDLKHLVLLRVKQRVLRQLISSLGVPRLTLEDPSLKLDSSLHELVGSGVEVVRRATVPVPTMPIAVGGVCTNDERRTRRRRHVPRARPGHSLDDSSANLDAVSLGL